MAESQLPSVGLVVHGGRERALAAARDIVAWLRNRGVPSRSLPDEDVGAAETRPAPAFQDGLDLVISVGGDGTLLRAARIADGARVPLLGVNVGRLGFLAEVEPAEVPAILEELLAGRTGIEERMALVATPEGASWTEPEWALNEVIVEKTARHRLITLRTEIDGEHVTTFSADGVIVATPTGSTAYSFSARGPIVAPDLACLVLTPVSPHMVFDRAMVLSPGAEVTLEVWGEEPGLLSADGRTGRELPVGARVRIRRADRPIRLVRKDRSPSFFSLVREKFWLPGEAPHGGPGPREGPGGTG